MRNLTSAAFMASMVVLATLIITCPGADAQSSGGTDMGAARAQAYHGGKAAIAVADFEDKTVGSGMYRAAYGRGMQDMLVTALFNTNRFIVLEREKLQAVITEQDMGASGRFRKDTAAPIGELEGAQLLVMAAVTGFDPGQAGARGGGSKKGLFGSDSLGALMGGFQQAHVAMDLRIVDTATGRVLAATNVEEKARSFDLGGSVFGRSAAGDLSGFARTPMEKAIRRAIEQAVEFVASQTPAEFYRY
jgi:curli biogenesis system outer membrane secretion channel CsgG